MSKRKNPLPILFSMVLLDQMASWMLLPILSLLFVEPASAFFLLKNPGQVQAVGYILLGLLFGVFPLTQFLAGPLLGEFSDRYGRKPIMVLAALCIAIGYVLFVGGIILHSISVLFIARILAGVGGGSLGVIFASAADISVPSERAKNFGIIAAASGLGLILGPLMGGILADSSIVSSFNLLTPLYALIILAVCNLLLVSFYFSETLVKPGHARLINWRKSLLYIREAYRNNHLRGVFLVSFLFSVCLALFVSFGPVLIYGRLGLSESSLSYFLGYFGFWVIVTQLGLVSVVLRLAREAVVLRDSLLAIFVGLFVFYFAPSWLWLILATPIIALGVALSYTMITTLLSTRTTTDKQGEVLGINTSVQSLAFALPGAFSGLIASQFSVGAPIIAAAVFVLIAALFVFSSKHF